MADDGDDVGVSVATSLGAVEPHRWDALANPAGYGSDPFVSHAFLSALEETGCVGGRSGWAPRHLLVNRGGALVGAAPVYLKSHSYGEYVFDHAWAHALERAGGRYYPKLQCASPFTPVTGRRLFAADDAACAALATSLETLCLEEGCSSAHVTFLTESEQSALVGHGFLARTGVQYHWFNAGYDSFGAFLEALSSSKRKTIRKERQRAQEGRRIRRLRGADIKASDWDFFFRCYMDTGSRKWGSPYLNRPFFHELGARMGDQCVLFIAEEDDRPIAAALNLLGSDAIFGRYWGCVAEVPFLHFELCYYQAIDYAIEHGLARVEAGAQGEHKLLRGYEPCATFSAHYIAHPGLRRAVADFLERERPAVADEIEQLNELTPFRKDLDAG